MSEFRHITEDFWASPQIAPEDVERAASLGVALIINNRPDGEEPGQVASERIAAAASQAGLAYRAIPVTHGGIGADQVAAMAEALAEAGGRVLAFCRSGTRSTLLWALARCSQGADPDELAQAAGACGYDLTPIRPALEKMAACQRR